MATNPIDRIGEVHGVYTLVELAPYKSNDGHTLYKGICNECGYERIAKLSDFNSKYSKKCTHISVCGTSIFRGLKWESRKLRKIFEGMKIRCYNPNATGYKWYGAKGVKICDEWLNNPQLFNDWSIANGYVDGMSINRIEEDKDYCPSNCEWITLNNNAKYKSSTSLIYVDGEVHTGKDWARIIGLNENCINKYVRKYGLENTIEFIKRFRENPNKKRSNQNQSYYNLYMNNT